MKTYEDARSSLRCVPNLLSPVLPKLNLVFQVSIILVRASSEDEKPLLHPANWAANWTANMDGQLGAMLSASHFRTVDDLTRRYFCL